MEEECGPLAATVWIFFTELLPIVVFLSLFCILYMCFSMYWLSTADIIYCLKISLGSIHPKIFQQSWKTQSVDVIISLLNELSLEFIKKEFSTNIRQMQRWCLSRDKALQMTKSGAEREKRKWERSCKKVISLLPSSYHRFSRSFLITFGLCCCQVLFI